MALLQFDAVTKTFPGPVTALDRFTLTIADRELVVIVGPSGSGKTTALRIVAGLERATSGTIRLDGKTINDWRPKDRDVAMVFQHPALFPHLSVRGNAAFSLRMRATRRDEINRRIGAAAADLGLTDLLDRSPDTLSGGQAQRVALLRAIVRRPNCLLLDEPFSNLDTPLRSELRGVFRAAHRRDPITTLFVTHDQDEALALADRLVVIRAGKIEQIGTPQQVYDQPANRFVASFLGAPPMNFLEGKLTARDGAFWFEHTDLRFPVTDSMNDALTQRDGRDIVIGFRPDAVTKCDPPCPASAANLTGKVTEQEFQGDRVLGRIRTASGAMISIASDNSALSIGETLPLCLCLDRLHFFAADERGLRL
jgi:multiple sugar transport system ATP-binding protein